MHPGVLLQSRDHLQIPKFQEITKLELGISTELLMSMKVTSVASTK